MLTLIGFAFVCQVIVSVFAMIGVIDWSLSQRVGVYSVGYEASVRKPFYIAIWRNL